MQLFHVDQNTRANVVVIDNGKKEIVVDQDMSARIPHVFFDHEIIADRDGFRDAITHDVPTKVLTKVARMCRSGCTAFKLNTYNAPVFLGYDPAKHNEAAIAIVPDHMLRETDES